MEITNAIIIIFTAGCYKGKPIKVIMHQAKSSQVNRNHSGYWEPREIQVEDEKEGRAENSEQPRTAATTPNPDQQSKEAGPEAPKTWSHSLKNPHGNKAVSVDGSWWSAIPTKPTVYKEKRQNSK